MEIADVTRRDTPEPLVPLWVGNVNANGEFKGSKAAILKWFEKTLPALEEYYKRDILEQLNNIHWYLGEYDKTQEYRVVPQDGGEVQVSRRMLPVIFSHLTDLTEQRVSRLSRFKPSFRVMPTNNERADQENARIMEMIIKNVKRRNDDELLYMELERWNAVCGQVYLGIEWDSSLGDKKDPDRPWEREGDVSMKLIPSWRVFPWPKQKWEDVPCLITIHEVLHLEEARRKYGKPNLKSDMGTVVYSFENAGEARTKDPEEVVVYRIYYKPDRFCTTGAFITLTKDTVLDVADGYPYSHEDFPLERYTDVDVPGRLMSISMYQYLKPMQHQYNKMTSMINRNISMLAHPKIMMPSGACKTSAWANTPLFVEYNSATPPQVVNFQTTNPEVYNYRNQIRSEMEQISGIQGVSRGTPPPNTRSGVQLLFFEEQEQQRASTQIVKRNEFIRRSLRKVGSVVSDYYPTSSEERLVREVGSENQHMLVSLNDAKISGTYDVEIQNATAFSDSKAGRISQILDVVQTDPSLLTREQKMDLLEIGNSDKVYDIHTQALRHAEWENQQIREGREVSDPKEYQDLIIHWRTHVIELQSVSFENEVSKENKEALLEHVEITEGLMEEQAMQNASFAQRLVQLENYPVIYHLTPEGEALLNPLKAQLAQEALVAQQIEEGGVPPQELVDELEPEALPPEELAAADLPPEELDSPVI